MAKVSQRGLEHIASFEGFRGAPYNDPVGYATIGYGHLLHRSNVTAADRKKWGTLTRAEGLKLLREDVAGFERGVDAVVKVPLSQHQFDALVAFAFNVGLGAFDSSTLLKELNRRHYSAVPGQLMRWTKAGGQTLPGLVRRRKAEGALFRKGSSLKERRQARLNQLRRIATARRKDKRIGWNTPMRKLGRLLKKRGAK
ncbi:MAG: lysozyme [Acidobacteria bacterium]|nr:lysozyme [Acidobacteriota bacterium]